MAGKYGPTKKVRKHSEVAEHNLAFDRKAMLAKLGKGPALYNQKKANKAKSEGFKKTTLY
tara:strand:+ start:204 stop:383 length:180 start_codon:yes stop_codon:yes gene_type:complete